MANVGQAGSQQRVESAAIHRSGFRIGGVSVQVAGHRSDDVALVASLEPFRSKTTESQIDVQVEWMVRLAAPAGRPLFDSGSVWRLYEHGLEFQFDFTSPIMGAQPYKRLFVDSQFRKARLQMSTESFARPGYAIAPLEYPLDELLIMHRLTQENAIELHSCGIARPEGTGNLFVGHSGAGKSTTMRLWAAAENVEVLSDDRIIVRRDPSNAGRMTMYGTPWHGEAAYASPGSAPLARIFVLSHGKGNVLTRLSPSQAVGELFARSFVPFHRHEYVDSALEFLQELVSEVPCYHYAFEPNEAAVERILQFCD